MWFVKHNVVLCSESCFVSKQIPSQKNVTEIPLCCRINEDVHSVSWLGRCNDGSVYVYFSNISR